MDDDILMAQKQHLVLIHVYPEELEILYSWLITLSSPFPGNVVIWLSSSHQSSEFPAGWENMFVKYCSLPFHVAHTPCQLHMGTLYVIPPRQRFSIDSNFIRQVEDDPDYASIDESIHFQNALLFCRDQLLLILFSSCNTHRAAMSMDVKRAGGTVFLLQTHRSTSQPMPMGTPQSIIDMMITLVDLSSSLSNFLTLTQQVQQEATTTEILQALLQTLHIKASTFRSFSFAALTQTAVCRMITTGQNTLVAYTRSLLENYQERTLFLRAALSPLCSFFRDEETFRVLRNEVLPALLARAEYTGKTLRLWSAGCATGEDAYSLAMIVIDLLGDALPLWNIRIFATDQDEAMLSFAKQGIYHENDLCHLSDQERTRWFKHRDYCYRIGQAVRDMVIFGQHNIAHDIPFSRMDLIMCREVLVSCSDERQHELMRLFTFSLLPRKGYLVLGQLENITPSSLNFQHITETAPIYQTTSDASAFQMPSRKRSSTTLLKQLLQSKIPSSSGATSTSPISLQDVLFRLAPIGIIIIDRSYRMIAANRAAYRLCSLPDQAHLQDFFHSIAGLPYVSVHKAIDMTFCEGSTQTLSEVELTLTTGGNGRVVCMQFCLLPTEVDTPDHIVAYIQEVTEHIITKQSYHNVRKYIAKSSVQLRYSYAKTYGSSSGS